MGVLGSFRRGAQLITSSILSALGGKTFAQRVAHEQGVSEFTLGAPVDVVAVDATMMPGAPTILALGGAASLAEGGYVAVVEPNFVVAGTPVAGLTQVLDHNVAVNAVELFDLATNEPVETAAGEEVFGLLQAWDDATTIDGVAVAAAAVENTQISFVYWSKAIPAVLTAYTLPAGQYGFRPARNHRLAYLDYSALLTGGDLLPDILTAEKFYLGEFTSNLTALAYIIAAGLDVGGMPQLNHNYWNTTRGCLRTWNGTIWEGHPTLPLAAVTVYVRSTGSDMGGDGSLADPYLTIAQAVEDGSTAIGYSQGTTINCQEAATFDLPAVIGYPGGNYAVEGTAIADWAVIQGSTAIVVVRDQLLNDAADDSGRRVTLTGVAGIAVNDWQYDLVEVLTGNLAGLYGWIIGNTASADPELWTELSSSAFSDDAPGTGFVNGDTVRILRPTTNIRLTGAYFGNYRRVKLQGQWGFYRLRLGFWDGATQGGVLENRGPDTNTFNEAAVSCTYGLSIAGGLNIMGSMVYGLREQFWGETQESWPGLLVPTLVDPSFYPYGGGYSIRNAGTFTFWERCVFCGSGAAPNFRIYAHAGVRMMSYDPTDLAADGQFIRLSGIREIRVDNGSQGTVPADWQLPHVIGAVSTYLFNYPAGNYAASLGDRIRMLDADVAITGALAYPNRCAVGVANVYAVPDQDIEIIGTGNYDKQLDVDLAWVGSVTPPDGELLGRQQVMAYDQAADEHAYSGFNVPAEYIPGKDLQFDFLYSSQDAGSGNDAEMGLETGLYRAGTDDVSADPPDNLNQDNGNLIEAVAVAGDLERSQRFDLTVAGEVDGIAVAAHQRIGVMLWRNADNAGVDTLAGDFYVLPDSVRIFMAGI